MDTIKKVTPSGSIGGVFIANSNTGAPIGDAAANDLLVTSFGFVPVASPTTIVEIIGVAGKRYRIKKIHFDGTVGSSLGFDFTLNERATASTGGSSTNQDTMSYNTLSVVTGLTVKAFTANPTPGSVVGRMRRSLFSILSAASTTYRTPDSNIWMFDNHGPVLEGVDDILTIDMAAPATSPTRLDVVIEYVEELI